MTTLMRSKDQLPCRRIYRPDPNVMSDIPRSSDPYVSKAWNRAIALPHRVYGPWFVVDKPSNIYNRIDIVETLVEQARGHWYYCLQIDQTPEEHKLKVYRFRYHVCFQELNDALIFKLGSNLTSTMPS